MRRVLPWVVLTACGPMESPLSTVDDLRIVDIRVEPAVPAVGEVPTVVPLVLDAPQDGFSTTTWWCTPDDTCGMGALPQTQFVTAYAMVCAPGVCDGPPDLAQPEVWLLDLPFEGVSVGQKTVGVTPSAAFRPNENPVLIAPQAWGEPVAPGETVTLEVVIEDELVERPQVLGYSTRGAWFEETRTLVTQDGGSTYTGEIEWTAPEEAGTVDVVLVIDDGVGGSAHGRYTIEVR